MRTLLPLLFLGLSVFAQDDSQFAPTVSAAATNATLSANSTNTAPAVSQTPLSTSLLSTASSASTGTAGVNSTNTAAVANATSTAAANSTNSTDSNNRDPAKTHTFVPFPTPTQGPVGNVFVFADPRNIPSVDNDLQTLPDFNPAWAAALERARQKVFGLSLEEKVNVTTGVGWANGRCVGNIPPIEPTNSRGFPGLCLEDSPLGVRDTDFVTVFPTGVNTAATFNRTLMRLRGLAMGQEHRGKGVNIALGPMMNMGRVAAGGRNWEGFGVDPFLTGTAAYETILGMQNGGVQACAKHFINNEQEHARTQSSSNVDDRTQHEIYAHPFLKSVMAGVATVMCSYNQINGTFACENDKLMNDILKREFGFQGLIMSDWSATHSTLSVLDGLDMTMPGDITFDSGTSFFGGNLTDFVKNGSIPENRLDDMAIRILGGWYLLGQDEPNFPAVNFNAFNPVDPATNGRVDVQDDHGQLVRTIGAASIVLLKNKNSALPLNKPRSLALIGLDAGPQPGGPNQFSDQGGNAGILAIGWGSGTANFTYLISPLEAIQARARQDRTTVNWHLDNFDTDGAGNIAIQADTAIVFVNSDSGEDYITVDGNEGDRKNLTAWHNGDALIAAVARQNKNTIVVTHSVGPLIIEPWIDHPNITAVLWAGVSGQETGNSLVDVLYGDVNPSGRLPYTIAKSASDYIDVDRRDASDQNIIQIPYTEGLNIDYRHFDSAGIQPRFEFGFGLSYTTFVYDNLQVTEVPSQAGPDLAAAWKQSQPSPNGQGSSAAVWLHEVAYMVQFTVTNTGGVAGGEIPQLYVNHPSSAGEPPSILKGFTDVFLQAGASKTVTITLSRYDLSIWDVISQSWLRPQGTIKLTVGASSRDQRLFGQIPS